MHVKAFTKAAHFGLNGQGAFTEDTHQQTQGGGLCQSSRGWPQGGCHQKRLCFQAIPSGKEAALKSQLVNHCKRQTDCDFGAAVERRRILPWALSQLAQHKSVQAGVLQQCCPFDPPPPRLIYLLWKKEEEVREMGVAEGDPDCNLQQLTFLLSFN